MIEKSVVPSVSTTLDGFEAFPCHFLAFQPIWKAVNEIDVTRALKPCNMMFLSKCWAQDDFYGASWIFCLNVDIIISDLDWIAYLISFLEGGLMRINCVVTSLKWKLCILYAISEISLEIGADGSKRSSTMLQVVYDRWRDQMLYDYALLVYSLCRNGETSDSWEAQLLQRERSKDNMFDLNRGC